MRRLGAVLGPLLAIGLMWALDGYIRAVLWLAVIPGIVAVWLIFRYVKDVPTPTGPPTSAPVPTLRLPAIRSLPAPFWHLAALAMVLTLPRISEAFLILHAVQMGVAYAAAPWVLVCLSLAYALVAYPAGKLSDRIPRMRMVTLGMFVLVIANALLASAHGFVHILVGVALWGMHLGLTQGVLASCIADTVPAAQRGTGFGVFNLVLGVSVLLASIGAGLIWDHYGPQAVFTIAGLIALIGMLWASVAKNHAALE